MNVGFQVNRSLPLYLTPNPVPLDELRGLGLVERLAVIERLRLFHLRVVGPANRLYRRLV